MINLAADVAAMGDALGLIVGGPVPFYIIMFGGICVAGVVFVSYTRFARAPKWEILVLLVYVATAFVVHIPLREIIVAPSFPASG